MATGSNTGSRKCVKRTVRVPSPVIADHPLPTFVIPSVLPEEFYVSALFIPHTNRRGTLFTPHKSRRCIMLFACPSQSSDSQGRRFESCRAHLKGTFLRCVSCHLDHVLSTEPALQKKPMPTLLPCRIPRLRSRPCTPLCSSTATTARCCAAAATTAWPRPACRCPPCAARYRVTSPGCTRRGEPMRPGAAEMERKPHRKQRCFLCGFAVLCAGGPAPLR